MAGLKKNAKGYFRQTFVYNGKRYQVYAKSKGELSTKVEEKKKELEEGLVNRINPPIREYYEYFTEVRRREQKESTIRGQIYQFKNIADVDISNGIMFGDIRIRDITRIDIETARQALLKDGKTPEYLNICFAHLNHVFETAMLEEVIDRNPCKALKRLKREAKPISETKHRALSEEETIRFIKAAEERNSIFTNLFKIMLQTGMRIGEASALYLTDIDRDSIHVRRSVTRDEVGRYIVGKDAKTESGIRSIPLNPELRTLIRDQTKLNEMIYGAGWSGTLFRSPEGELLREYTVNREIKRICKASGIECFTCHAFRVTFATRFIEQRPQDYKVLSEIMGHKDIQITLNLYTRVMEESKITAMNNIKIKTS